MKNLYILILLAIFLLSACNHNSKPNPPTIKLVNKPIINRKVNADTPFCADYNNAGDYYADDGPTLIEYEHKRKGYFNGKTKLSEDYVRKYLFDEMWAISDTTVWNKDTSQETLDEISSAEYYLIKTVTITPMYKGIVYEKLTNEESTKYFLTIDKNGRFISRILLAWYGPLGTYVDDKGEKHPYYTSLSGCIYKDGTIQLVDDRSQQRITDDNDTYEVHSDGQITRVVPKQNHTKIN
ncbi:MAG: hypothetical protein JWQ79_2071 [Mucilaginibacter sp.]|nr:hypothetical protein [Mucilaginibacter sp.]